MTTYWLLKSEPNTYSFQDLVRDRKTNWDGVRNFQARNNLRQIARGDQCLIYHSGDERAVVGIAEVIRESYPDVDPEGGDWVQVDLKPVRALAQPVTLAQIKASTALKEMPLIKQSRLSVMKITPKQFEQILKMGAAK